MLCLRHCQEITRKAMTNNSRVFSGTIRKTVVTAVICFGIIGATTLTVAPSAEANQRNRQIRGENMQLRRVMSHDRRVWIDTAVTTKAMEGFAGAGRFVLPTPKDMNMDTGKAQGITVLQA